MIAPAGSFPFDLGRIGITHAAAAALEAANISVAAVLARHASGDWGEATAEETIANYSAAASGE